MRFFCTSLKSCNADHCGCLSGRPGSVRRFPHRMSSEAQKVACFLAPLKQNPSPAALLCGADVLVSSTSTILPRRALKTFRKMLFMCGLWGGSCVSVCLRRRCGAGFRPYDEAFPDHLRADRPQYALGLTRAGPGAGMGGRGERQRACGGRTVHRDGGDASSTRRYQRFHPYLFRHFSAPERRIERFAGHPLRFVERGRQDRPGRLGRAEGALQGR